MLRRRRELSFRPCGIPPLPSSWSQCGEVKASCELEDRVCSVQSRAQRRNTLICALLLALRRACEVNREPVLVSILYGLYEFRAGLIALSGRTRLREYSARNLLELISRLQVI